MTVTDFLALLFGTWGTAWLLVYGTGPAAMLARLRQRLGVRYDVEGDGHRYGETWMGELFNCPICLSVWLAPVLLAMIMLGLWPIAWCLAAVGLTAALAGR